MEQFEKEMKKVINKELSYYEDSFKEKMDEFIEMEELSEPFIVENKENHELVMEIDLGTVIGSNIFNTLFERCFGYKFSRLFDDFKITNIDRYLDEMGGEYGTMILKHKDDERETLIFNPCSRLGRLIIHITIDPMILN